jgi:hypothetical protein
VADRRTGKDIAIFLLTLVQHCLNILSDESCTHYTWCQLSGFGPVCFTLQGKIVHGGNLHGNEEESKKEKEALSESLTREKFHWAFLEKHLPKGLHIFGCDLWCGKSCAGRGPRVAQ